MPTFSFLRFPDILSLIIIYLNFFITPGENLGISRVNFLEFMYEPYSPIVYMW